jgi:hypothetical protein
MRRSLALAFAITLTGFAGVALADDKDKEAQEAVSAFKKAYASKDESARESAVEALASVQSHRVVDALADPLLHDKESSVRRAAAKVIGGEWDKSACSVLMRALNPDDPAKDVVTAIINALGQTENEQAVPLLVSLLEPKRKGQQDTPAFTAPALEALKKIGSAKATDDLITFLNRESAGNRSGGRRGGGSNSGGGQNSDPFSKDAEAAIRYITGQQFSSAADWRKWWNENQSTLKLIPVYRSAATGEKIDKTDSKVKIPSDAYLLKTRFDGGDQGNPDGANHDEPKHKSRNNNNNNGGNNNGGGNNNSN